MKVGDRQIPLGDPLPERLLAEGHQFKFIPRGEIGGQPFLERNKDALVELLCCVLLLTSSCIARHRFDYHESQSFDANYAPVSPSSTSPNISPRDNSSITNDFGNYRRELLGSALETSGGTLPLIQHGSPISSQIAPWMSSGHASTVVPASAFQTTFYNDSSDNLSQTSQLSPGVRPGSGRTGNTSDSPEAGFFNDERRPSLASVTTASSSGSKSSVSRTGGFHKKLQGFFGEDFTGKESSETSLPSHESRQEQRAPSYSRHRERNHSARTQDSHRELSPAPSRPRTPVPSSDVVPFLYQDSQVSKYFVCGQSPAALSYFVLSAPIGRKL